MYLQKQMNIPPSCLVCACVSTEKVQVKCSLSFESSSLTSLHLVICCTRSTVIGTFQSMQMNYNAKHLLLRHVFLSKDLIIKDKPYLDITVFVFDSLACAVPTTTSRPENNQKLHVNITIIWFYSKVFCV